LRRTSDTSDRRISALEQYEAEAGEQLTQKGALLAFLDTDLDLCYLYYKGGEEWMNYAAFCARVILSNKIRLTDRLA
jgi:hypothetical protein